MADKPNFPQYVGGDLTDWTRRLVSELDRFGAQVEQDGQIGPIVPGFKSNALPDPAKYASTALRNEHSRTIFVYDTGELMYSDGAQWVALPDGTGGQVNSVQPGPNMNVDASDPVNPIVSYTGPDGQVDAITASTPLSVDSTDPTAPDVRFPSWPADAEGQLTNDDSGGLSWTPSPSLRLVGQTLLERTSSQSIPDADRTPVEWGSAAYDTVGAWSSGAPSDIVVPTLADYARVTCSLTLASNATGRRELISLVDGSPTVGHLRQLKAASPSSDTTLEESSAIMPVTSGAVITIEVLQNSGGSLDLRSGAAVWLQVEWFV